MAAMKKEKQETTTTSQTYSVATQSISETPAWRDDLIKFSIDPAEAGSSHKDSMAGRVNEILPISCSLNLYYWIGKGLSFVVVLLSG